MASPFLSVSLTGDKAVLANIKALDKKITTKAITKASREAQKKTAADAKRRVPVKTGKLKDWIKVRAVPKKYLMRKFGLTKIEARAVSAIAVTTGAGKATDYPYYGLFLEKGTKERGTYERFIAIKASGGVKVRRVRVGGELKKVRHTGRIEPGKFDFLKPALFADVSGKRQIVVSHLKAAIRTSAKTAKR